MDRRAFLKSSLVGAGVIAGISKVKLDALAQDAPRKEAVLKLCSQDGRIAGGSVKEKAETILKYGGCGLEFGGMDVRRAEQIKKELEGTGVGPAALCWGSHGGDLVSTDVEKRKKGIQAIKNVLEAAGALGSTGVVFVPCFNGQSNLKPEELDKILLEILPEIGDYARQVKSRVLLEPLNKGETFYLRRLEQAAAICNKLDNPGICMMGDFYHMAKEEKSDEEAFVTGGKWVHHVHLATGKSRILPGQEEHSYVAGFKGLKRIGYQDYCSLECGLKRGTKWEEEIPKAFAFLKQQWEEARI